MPNTLEIKDGKVLRVIVVDPKNALDEAKGIAFCKKLVGGDWKQKRKRQRRLRNNIRSLSCGQQSEPEAGLWCYLE